MSQKFGSKVLALIVCAAFVLPVWAARHRHASAQHATAASAASAASSTSSTSASDDDGMTLPQFIASLHPQTGAIEIPGANATLTLGKNYIFLPADDAQRVATGLWNNPPDSDILGMILPGTDPKVVADEKAWAVLVYYVDDGYVSDEDAGKIDYDEMLKDMQKSARDDNPERVKQGYPAMELVGWAEPPHYDAASHKLYWARDVKTTKANGTINHTLNYGIRVLGRKGYLSLDALAPIDQLAQVRADMKDVVTMANFDAGQRYADYKSGTDKLAAYGIGALIAGVAVKKLGLLALAGAFLLKFAKIGIVAALGLLAGFKRFFRRKPKNRTPYDTQAAQLPQRADSASANATTQKDAFESLQSQFDRDDFGQNRAPSSSPDSGERR